VADVGLTGLIDLAGMDPSRESRRLRLEGAHTPFSRTRKIMAV
jgi:hypothetical protein